MAIALTLLEGDKYKVLVPSDYIAHLRKHPGYNRVEGAYTANNKIGFWVKESILHYDAVDKRAEVLKFFIHTALVSYNRPHPSCSTDYMGTGMSQIAQFLLFYRCCCCFAFGADRATEAYKGGTNASTAGQTERV